MKRSLLALALILVCGLCFAQEAPNPFTAHNMKPRTGFLSDVNTTVFSLLYSLMAPMQKVLNESLARTTRALENSHSLRGLVLVAAFALAYGVFHAAGPGHGKTIISSFLLANNSKIRHSFTVGYLVGGVHALSALMVVLVLYYLIRGVFAIGLERANHYIQLVIFAAIMVIGALMLVRRIAGKTHMHNHLHVLEHDTVRELTIRNLFSVAVPAGLIPCAGAVAVILFALSLHMLMVSILAVLSISLGMGTTIGAVGAVVILAKRGAICAVTGSREERESKVRRVVEIAGAAILFLFGLLIFLAQL